MFAILSAINALKKRCSELSLAENWVVVKIGGMRLRCGGPPEKGWVWSVRVWLRRVKSWCCALDPNSAGGMPA